VLAIDAEEACRSTAKALTLAKPLRNRNKKVNMMKTPDEAATMKRNRLNPRELGFLYGSPSKAASSLNVIPSDSSHFLQPKLLSSFSSPPSLSKTWVVHRRTKVEKAVGDDGNDVSFAYTCFSLGCYLATFAKDKL
jgi:hypothetical protein